MTTFVMRLNCECRACDRADTSRTLSTRLEGMRSSQAGAGDGVAAEAGALAVAPVRRRLGW